MHRPEFFFRDLPKSINARASRCTLQRVHLASGATAINLVQIPDIAFAPWIVKYKYFDHCPSVVKLSSDLKISSAVVVDGKDGQNNIYFLIIPLS